MARELWVGPGEGEPLGSGGKFWGVPEVCPGPFPQLGPRTGRVLSFPGCLHLAVDGARLRVQQPQGW